MDIENEKIREAAYWRERYNILNATNAQLTRQTYDEAERAFELAKRDIQRDIDAWLNRFADNNGVSLVEARKLLNSNELKELKWDIAEYIKRGRENAISGKWAKELENASVQLHISRLEALKIRTQNHLETAFAAENKAVENLVKNVYKSDYYHTCFELQKGFDVDFDISVIDERQLDMIIKKPWTVDRRTFSDRIWERKDKMVSALHQEMIRNCIYGRSRKEMTVALEQFVKKDIKNAEYCAARVIKTETAYFTSQSQRQALSDLDCEMYEVYLPLSPKSCEICREMNGKHFKLSEYVVGSTAPPFHPNCENGSIIPYYEDSFFDNIKSGEKIPDDITYPEWEKKFVKDNGLTKAGEGGTIKESHNRASIDMSQGSLIKQRPHKKYTSDVTDEYIRAATPRIGGVVYDEGYKEGKHRDEIITANWLFNTFGGKIMLLTESEIRNQNTPDYLWNGKFWELKATHSINGADKNLQHAIKQIRDNPGGVILDLLDDLDIQTLEKQLIGRFLRSELDTLDIMLLQKGALLKIIRHKK